MISLEQVLLLQEKVENAVQKITQLKTENDMLRKKCAELTSALSAESGRISAFESDQSKIESSILTTLDRLNSVENYVLAADTHPTEAVQPEMPKMQPAEPQVSSAPAAPAQEVPLQSAPQQFSPAPDAATPNENQGGEDSTFDIF